MAVQTSTADFEPAAFIIMQKRSISCKLSML